jgi:hypothetical protein
MKASRATKIWDIDAIKSSPTLLFLELKKYE